MDGGTGGGMNGGKNELHLCGGGLWHTLNYTKCMAGILFSYPLKLISHSTNNYHVDYQKLKNGMSSQNMSHKECQIKHTNYLQIVFYP